MSQVVKGDGSSRARIVIIGEAPARHEVAQGRPFVGPSGHTLTHWLTLAELQRSDCYIDNVMQVRAPGDKIERVPPHELAPWVESLHERLAALEDPWVIVPTGNTALEALIGRRGITKLRGSIYTYTDRRGRPIKVIPTIHPAAIFRKPDWERRCILDWRRIAEDATFRETRLPEREHFIRPTLDDIRAYVEDARQRADCLVLDVETPRELKFDYTSGTVTKKGTPKVKKTLGEPRVTCVGFSFEPGFSLTIPTLPSYWNGQHDDMVKLLRELCTLPVEKGTQNGPFDQYWMRWQFDIPVTHWTMDTRWLNHACDPLDDGALAYQASLYTREPYWKDDAKDEGEFAGDALDPDLFWRYNGKDCCVTRELVDVHLGRLNGRAGFYRRHYQALFPLLLRASLHGVRVNQGAQRKELGRLLRECIAIQDRLTKLAGEPLYGPKGSLSTKKLATFLYDTLHLPRQFERKAKPDGTRGVTTKEVVVRKLMLRYPNVMGKLDETDKPGPLILAHRRKDKLTEFVGENVCDPDGRSRCSYGWVNTMRLSSKKNPRRTGQNHQNIDRELLKLYVPDEGCYFLEVDESQAEDRVVKMLTRSPRLIERARAKPWENDEHVRAARIIFGKTGDVTKDERYIGKRTRHAGNYGERGMKHSEVLLNEGYTFTPDECEAMIQAIIDRDTPEVREWQRDVRMTVLRDRALANSWGAVFDFTYQRLSDDLYRKAYATIPQSEVVSIINQWGWVPLGTYIRTNKLRSRVNMQRHDSLLISVFPGEGWEIACNLKQWLERPRTYHGNELTIPCEFKVGSTAACGTAEFKRFPSREEFEDAAERALKATLPR